MAATAAARRPFRATPASNGNGNGHEPGVDVTLLDKALKARVVRTNARQFTDEDYELAAAFLTGRVTVRQVSIAIDKSVSAVYNYLTMCIKEMVQEEYLILNSQKHESPHGQNTQGDDQKGAPDRPRDWPIARTRA